MPEEGVQNFDRDERQALVSDIRTILLHTEHSGRTDTVYRFSLVPGRSTYSFGVPQFDVGNNTGARNFLLQNGFTPDQVHRLSQHDGIPNDELRQLNEQLQAHEHAIEQYTDQYMESRVDRLNALVNDLRNANPDAATAILNDRELQLAIVDYDNQYVLEGIGSRNAPVEGMLAYLRGQPVHLRGGRIHLQDSDALSVDDLRRFVERTRQGVNHPGEVRNRQDRFNRAIDSINSGQRPRSDLDEARPRLAGNEKKDEDLRDISADSYADKRRIQTANAPGESVSETTTQNERPPEERENAVLTERKTQTAARGGEAPLLFYDNSPELAQPQFADAQTLDQARRRPKSAEAPDRILSYPSMGNLA